MTQRLTWGTMKKTRNKICHVCGATRDYLERDGSEVNCTLCGNTWFSVNSEIGEEYN